MPYRDVELKVLLEVLLILGFLMNRGVLGSSLVCGVVRGSEADGK